MNHPATHAQIDVRTLEPRERHPLIFSTFSQLRAGQALELINDHDPRPLHARFMVDKPGEFGWEYLEQGPETWRVAITRLPLARSSGQCCGSCGGT